MSERTIREKSVTQFHDNVPLSPVITAILWVNPGVKNTIGENFLLTLLLNFEKDFDARAVQQI